MVFKPYVIQASDPVKLRFFTVPKDEIKSLQDLTISLDIIDNSDKVHVLMGIPEGESCFNDILFKPLCTKLLYLMETTTRWLNPPKTVVFYFLNCWFGKACIEHLIFNPDDLHSDLHLQRFETDQAPFNIKQFENLGFS